MGYAFPNARNAVFALLDGLTVDDPPAGPPVTLTAFLRLTTDLDAHLPAAHVRRVGGTEDGPLRTDRVAVDVYAAGSDAAEDYADAVREHLAGSSHHVPGVGLLDAVTVEVVPTEVPYASDTVSRVTGTYRVDTRGL
jgi:hypothetical protein